MICEKPASRTAASFAGSVPAREIVSMPKSRMLESGAFTTASVSESRAFIVYQFEHDAAEIALSERAAGLGMHSLRFDEGNAALPQCRDSLEHVRRSQASALQQLQGLGIEYARLGVDELQVEAVARTFQDAPLGENAVALLVGQDAEPEELRVELDPLRHAIAADILDDAEPMQAGQRRRVRIHAGIEREIHVVDRELAIAIDEVDAARSDAMDRGDIELHHFDLERNDPRPVVDRVSVCSRGVTHAKRDRRDHRRFSRLYRTGLAARMGVDDDVHVSLPVEQHLARAVACDRAKAHHLQHLTQRLRLARRILDELDTIHRQRVAGDGGQFTVGYLCHVLLLLRRGPCAWKSLILPALLVPPVVGSARRRGSLKL